MKKQTQSNGDNEFLITNLIELLEKANAHATLDDALDDIPFSLLKEKPGNLPYSIWQLAEHIRIAQWDILDFSHNAKHKSPKWPDDYWPKEAGPASEAEWKACVKKIKEDRETFIKLIKNSGGTLFTIFEYGDGQTLLREALLVADHNAYHTAEIIVIRRLLNNWKK